MISSDGHACGRYAMVLPRWRCSAGKVFTSQVYVVTMPRMLVFLDSICGRKVHERSVLDLKRVQEDGPLFEEAESVGNI